MKKLIIFFVFLIACLSTVTADEQTIVKIGKNLTIYNYKNYSELKYWGQNVIIEKTEIILPDDSYFKGLKIPEKEWAVFSQNQNGIYDSRLEKVIKEKEELRTDYNKLFAKKSEADSLINLLEASIGIIVLVIIFVGLSVARKKFQKKLESAKM